MKLLPILSGFLLVVLLASPGFGQVADLVQITPLAANETGGCYVGTNGTDATLFLRSWPNFQGCDIFDPNSDLCLTRLEFAGDQPSGTTISQGDSAQLRHSVAGDGSFAWFSRNIDLCLIETNQIGQDICFNLPPQTYVHTAAVNPQGNRVALVPRDLNNINLPANVIQVHLATFPDLPLLEQYQFNNPLIFPETVDFMAKETWLVFDATNDQFGGGDWGLYVLNRATLELRTLAAPIAGYQLRNPVFGQTSDQVIAFDAVEIATGRTTILTANIVSGEVREIAQIDLTFGIPSFSGDDSFLIYNREDASTFSTASLRRRNLAADGFSPVGAEQAWVTDAGYGTIYRRGAFDTTSVTCPATSGPGSIGGSLQITKNNNPALIDMSWNASCSASATDYSIHEGELGNWYSHTSTDCATGGTTSNGYSPAGANRYFLVVPVSASEEGAYGMRTNGTDRPVSTTACQSTRIETGCP